MDLFVVPTIGFVRAPENAEPAWTSGQLVRGVLINAGFGGISALGPNRTRHEGGVVRRSTSALIRLRLCPSPTTALAGVGG